MQNISSTSSILTSRCRIGSASIFYAKRNEDGAWVPLYVGAGDLATRCNDPALRLSIDAKAPTHVHLRSVKRDKDRTDEVRDLLNHHRNAFPLGWMPAGLGLRGR